MELHIFVIIIAAFIIACVFTMPFTFVEIFGFSYGFDLLSWVLLFQPVGLPGWNKTKYFVYLEISLFCSHFWRIVLPNIRFLTDSFFLSDRNISSQCLLVSKVPVKKSAGHLIDDSFCVICHFSLATLKILCSFKNLIVVLLGVGLWVYF